MSETPRPLTVGTAGHVDHGKSALVHALTGARTDRLPEERVRGMTIALGYSRLRLPGGRTLSLIDVPGHERLVRVMVSGASGIDMFLLALAADDGVMPQTIEHVSVLRALGVRAGVVAVTKRDLADPAAAVAAARELLPGTTVVACSARTGEGIGELARALDEVAGTVRSRAARGGPCVLHVDRVFTVRGAGTVVTGTLWSGAVQRGQRLALLPDALPVRVRAVQVHDEFVDSAHAGQRVAVNLNGISREDARPGDVLASPDAGLRASHLLDCELELRGPVPHGSRVQVHHGTRESAARIVPLGGSFWQLRCERALLAARGDRVVVRAISVPDTLGGGCVMDAQARRHSASGAVRARLRALAAGGEDAPNPVQAPNGRAASAAAARGVGARGPQALGRGALALERRLREAGLTPPSEVELGEQARHLGELRAAGRAVRVGRSMYAHPEALEQLAQTVRAIVDAEGAVTLARLRDELGTSRRYAQALLEHMDAARVTRRLPDDTRVLRRVR